jgi:hypothetical protein
VTCYSEALDRQYRLSNCGLIPWVDVSWTLWAACGQELVSPHPTFAAWLLRLSSIYFHLVANILIIMVLGVKQRIV